MQKKVLVVAAHPDDETLGCAGAISKYVSLEDQVYIITLTDGLVPKFYNKLQGLTFSHDISRGEPLQKNLSLKNL
jgi:LmbE family N-acetylglucosaminyl deacetylase